MLASVAENHSFDECKEVLRKREFQESSTGTKRGARERGVVRWMTRVLIMADISLDPGFKECYTWCKANGVPFIIVSR